MAEKYDMMDRNYESQSDEDKKLAKSVIDRWERLDSDATNWTSHWEECYENIVPRKDDVNTKREPGDERNDDLYDTTAILSNEMLASALHGMLTNPETKFFEITFSDPALDQDEAVKEWAQEVGNRMFRVLNNTNFQTEIYEIYIDLGAIGTACLYMGEHDENVVHFSARAMKEVRVEENRLGLIDVVFRKFEWKADHIVQEFGEDNVPSKVLKAHEKDEQDKFEIIHVVEPAFEDLDEEDNLKGFQYKSTYVLRECKYVLSKSGYREFPYAVPRWSKTSGEIYGRGPGMAMLPDIRMVNAMMLTVIQGAQKTVDPPLQIQDDGVIGVVRLTPGGLTVVRPGSEPIKPLITDARIDFGQQVVEDVRNRIRSGFYVDRLNLQRGPQMTAEEVKQRTEETLRLMGPVLGRQHFELLKPLIERLFNIMVRREMLPPAPKSIQGKKFDVRYSSLIARAQRLVDAQNMGRALSLVQPIAVELPETRDVIDGDGIVREVWDIFGLPHKLLLDKREVEDKRKQRAQMQAAMLQQQQQMNQAEMMQKAAPMVSAVQPKGGMGVPSK